MFTEAELWQMQIETICDHLIDRDDYFALDGDQVVAFLEWAKVRHIDFTDIDGLDIDQMFDKWLSEQARKAA